MTITWTADDVQQLLFTPHKLVGTQPWKSWVLQQGGLAAVYTMLRTLPLRSQDVEVLQVILDDPHASVLQYAERLYLQPSSYHARKKGLLTRLATMLSSAAMLQATSPTVDALPPLPIYHTVLVGRASEVQQVRELLCRPEVSLVSVTGPGGVGKTRLALQVAQELQEALDGQVCFVPLVTISDPALVLPTIMQTLGLQSTQESPLASLTAYLHDRELLLVLDNVEQVLDAAAAISQLLQGASRLKLLVTSRRVLRIGGEYEFPLLPLPLPVRQNDAPGASPTLLAALADNPAVQVFCQRAQAVKRDFGLTVENAAAVVEICGRLDGLPLALELAAARSKLLSPALMLSRLDQPLSVLTSGARDLPAHQQTLRSTLDWSYELLTSAEQRLFARLAIFVGGWTLGAAEAICGGAGLELPVLDGLEALLNHSLLTSETQPGREPRLRMLAMIREYALEKLAASGEQHALARCHASYFLELAETAEPHFRSNEKHRWLMRLQAEYPNLRVALTWTIDEEPEQALRLSAALWRFWHWRGDYSEGRRWLDLALRSTPAAPASIRARGLHALGVLTFMQGDLDEAATAYEASLALRRELGDRWGTAALLNNLALIMGDRGEYEQAVRLFEECLALRRELGDSWGIASALGNLGIRMLNLEQFEQAAVYLEESKLLRQQLGDTPEYGIVLTQLGWLACCVGDYARADGLLSESLKIMEQLEMVIEQADIFEAQARVRIGVGDLVPARQLLVSCIRILQRQGPQDRLRESLGAFAALLAAEGQAAAAARVLGATSMLIKALATTLSPLFQHLVDRIIAQILEQISQAEFEAAWQAGQVIPLEQLVAELLG